MPGYTRRSVYTEEMNSEFRFRILDVLNNNDEAMTAQQIQEQDMILKPLSIQKMSRLLAYLVDMGLVRKGKAKTAGSRMMYKSVSKMLEQGYNVDTREIN